MRCDAMRCDAMRREEKSELKDIVDGALKDVDTHFTVCEFTVTNCSYDGCNIPMERRMLGHHVNVATHCNYNWLL